VVNQMFSFIDRETAEVVFTELVEFFSPEADLEDIGNALDDGYMDCSKGNTTICIGEPDSDFNNDYLKEIRRSI
jgi:hypothetical protein